MAVVLEMYVDSQVAQLIKKYSAYQCRRGFRQELWVKHEYHSQTSGRRISTVTPSVFFFHHAKWPPWVLMGLTPRTGKDKAAEGYQFPNQVIFRQYLGIGSGRQ